MTNYDNVPQQLKALNQWVTWKIETDYDGRERKVPYDPNGIGSKASVTDPTTWGSFDEAILQTENWAMNGIGFVFKDGGGIFGIDIDSIDKVALENRVEALKLRELIWNNFPTYCERSPSGKGMHYIGFGSLPEGMRGIKDSKYQIEIYDKYRFFTITGNMISRKDDNNV